MKIDSNRDLQKQPFRNATLLKSDSNAGVFLCIMRNFWEHAFLENTYGGCLWTYLIEMKVLTKSEPIGGFLIDMTIFLWTH